MFPRAIEAAPQREGGQVRVDITQIVVESANEVRRSEP